MKNKLLLFMLFPMTISLFGCKSSNEKTPVDVVLISGQSNGVGCTWCNQIADDVKYNEYYKGFSDVKISFDSWTKDWPASGVTYFSQNDSGKEFVDVKLGQGNGKHSFGPEIGIAEELHERHANKLFLIKFACGGSNLKDDWLAKDSPMYPLFIKYVKEQMDLLKKKGYAPTIKAFCWMQGEGDSYYGYYQFYKANLETFVANVRADLRNLSGNKEIPFIDAGINNNAARWQYWKQINDAKQEFAAESENNFYIDTIGAGMHTNQEPRGNVDADHYDSESEILLGHLFAQTFEQFLIQPKK